MSISILNVETTLNCPFKDCEYPNIITLDDLDKSRTIICKGCRREIKLKNTGDDISKVDDEIKKSLSKLSKKISIKIKI